MAPKVSSTKKLVSASALMASGTLVSRALGLVRVMLVAFIFGNTTRQADMLALATMVPNSLYILFAGGALNTVLVPQIVRAIRNDPDGGEAYTNRIMTAFMLIVGAVAVLVTVGAPIVTGLYTSEAWRAPELADQYASMVMLTYLTLPQVFFYGSFFLLGQVLNARDTFGPMMWAPIANNVISILVMLLYVIVWGTGGDRGLAFTTGQLLVLGLGSTFGIAAQTLVLIPYLRRVGFKFRPRFDLKGTGLGHTFSLTKWTIGFVAVNQLALLIVTRLATSATAGGAGGGVDVYSKAHLIWILPHSLITVSLTTAMLPNASRLAAAADLKGVAAEATKTMRLALILLVPASVGFFSLAGPIASLLFGHGHGASGSAPVAWALMAFAVGLVPFTVQFVCLRTYYAMENTRTPFWLQVVIAGLNAALALLLVWVVTDPGLVAAALALSYSLAYVVGVLVSWRHLVRRVPDLDGGAMGMHALRLTLASAVGGAAAYYLSALIIGHLGSSVWTEVAAVVAGLAVLGVAYLAGGKLLKVRELGNLAEFVGTLRPRRGRNQPAAVADPTPAPTAPTPEPDREELREEDWEESLVGTSTLGLAEDLMPTQITAAITDDWEDDAPPPGPPVAFSETPVTTAGTQLPDTQPFPRPDLPEEDVGPAPICRPGELLELRYRLDELLSSGSGIETWRAHDLVLSRDVVAHLLGEGDPRIEESLTAARRRATATDSRLLRVLDATADVRSDDAHRVGAFIVCEHVPGTSLTDLLARGALGTLESAWIVRELADALTGMHANGLFHDHVDPDNIVVTTHGDVRLVGFGREAMTDPVDPALSWSERESADVRGLAAVLYAALVQRWPGRAAYGLDAAPVIAGETAGPHVVRGGVSPTLDRIVSATLTTRGAAADRRITTASQLAGALTEVLGTADATHDLQLRVHPDGRFEEPSLPGWLDSLPDDVFKAETSPPVSIPAPAPPATAPVRPSEEVDGRVAPPTRERRTLRPLVWLLATVAVAALIGWLVWSAVTAARDDVGSAAPSGSVTAASPSASGGGSATATPPAGSGIVAAKDFDPEADGGSGDENPDQAPLAIDGDKLTGWATLRYKNRADLGGLKPGVGLVLDLGAARTVGEVRLLFAQPGASVELLVPEAADATQPPLTTIRDWRRVAEQEDVPAEVTLAPAEPPTSRWVLVYLTSLPKVEEGRFQAQLNEVAVP